MSAVARGFAVALGVVAMALLYACAVSGVGVEGDVGVGYAAGYYEPWGYDYGGWGGGYLVGPGRGGDFRGHRPPHSYRPAPAGRPMPSIPGRARGR